MKNHETLLPPAYGKNRIKQAKNLTFWIFSAPCVIALIMVIIIPFCLGVYYSFTDWNAVNDNINWIGFENYKRIFEPTFLHAFFITAVYAVFNIISVNIIAFGLALLVTGALKGKNFFRSGYFVPNLIGGLILGFIWQFVFEKVLPQFGETMGSEFWESSFLETPNLALAAIIIVSAWQYAGYIMMIYIAGIQNISHNLSEAAQIDGAGYWQRLRHILFPMLAPAFTIATFLTLVNSFKQFDVNISLTFGDPPKLFMDETVRSTELFALNIYKEAFTHQRMASSQARSVVFFFILVVISLIQVYANKRREVEL